MGNRLAKQHMSSASFLHFSQNAGDPELAPCTMKKIQSGDTPWKFDTFASENVKFAPKFVKGGAVCLPTIHFFRGYVKLRECD